jgi:hypothetical protein
MVASVNPRNSRLFYRRPDLQARLPETTPRGCHAWPRDGDKNGGDIQATTKVVDCRSLKSSPPNFARAIVSDGFLTIPEVRSSARSHETRRRSQAVSRAVDVGRDSVESCVLVKDSRCGRDEDAVNRDETP